MAGSYIHTVDDNGDFLDNEKFVGLIENLGDAYEAAEEMYGMIWHIASQFGNPQDVVERARKNYKEGLAAAKAIEGKPH